MPTFSLRATCVLLLTLPLLGCPPEPKPQSYTEGEFACPAPSDATCAYKVGCASDDDCDVTPYFPGYCRAEDDGGSSCQYPVDGGYELACYFGSSVLSERARCMDPHPTVSCSDGTRCQARGCNVSCRAWFGVPVECRFSENFGQDVCQGPGDDGGYRELCVDDDVRLTGLLECQPTDQPTNVTCNDLVCEPRPCVSSCAAWFSAPVECRYSARFGQKVCQGPGAGGSYQELCVNPNGSLSHLLDCTDGGADAGISDAGTTPLDAGHDAGATPLDAGHDAGATPLDAGHDAGATPHDAGLDAGPPDAGPGIILTFTATPSTVNEPGSVTMAWTTDNADECTLSPSPFSVLSANSSVTITPDQSRDYTLTCRRGSDFESRVVHVTVILIPRPVVINSFDPQSLLVSLGDPVTLSWSIDHATSCVLVPDAGAVTLPTGTAEVTPTADAMYTLTCQGFMGPVSATSNLTVVANNAPDGVILSPDAGATIEVGDLVTLVGQCNDDNVGGTGLAYGWVDTSSSVSIADGASVPYSGFTTPGPDTVELRCIDAMGKSDPTPPSVTVNVVLPTVDQLAYGQNHVCLHTMSGKVYCVGDNQQGQLAKPLAVVQSVLPVVVGAGQAWQSVDADTTKACAINNAQELWCWGGGVRTPTRPDLTTGWSQVSGSGTHTCATKSSGELYCWGANTESQLGVTGGARTAPTRVGTASDWAFVATGGNTSCAVNTANKLFCWGSNTSGAAGTASGTTVASPTAVAPSLNVTSVSLGTNFGCLITTTGELHCWGLDTDGQLGDGTASATTTPQPARVGLLSNWVEVSTGSTHTCARNTPGELYCWGSDLYGQLGNGALGATATPQRVGLDDGWSQVSAGTLGTCAARGGHGYCWGRSHFGQAGTGTATGNPVTEPSEVRFVP